MTTAYFMLFMLIGSLLGFAKLFALAYVMPADAFTHYTTYFTSAAALASLVSFGLVEGTWKRFTRLVSTNNVSAVHAEARLIAGRLVVRNGLLGLMLVGLAVVLRWEDPLLPLALTLQVGSVWQSSLLASLIRAHLKLSWLATLSIVRSMIAMFAALGAASVCRWETVLLVESAVSILAISIYRKVFEAGASEPSAPAARSVDVHHVEINGGGGTALFFAFLIGSLPLTLNRWFVLVYDTPFVAKQYAFVAIWLAAAYTFVAIVAQKFGPEIVSSTSTVDDRRQADRLVRTTRNLAAMLFVISFASIVALWLLFPLSYWAKYELDFAIAASVSIACALQVSHLSEWILIAFDQESRVLASSVVFCTTCAVLFVLVAFIGGGTVGYLVAGIVARVVQMVVLAYFVNYAVQSRGAVARNSPSP
jgi:hypothetical protein